MLRHALVEVNISFRKKKEFADRRDANMLFVHFIVALFNVQTQAHERGILLARPPLTMFNGALLKSIKIARYHANVNPQASLYMFKSCKKCF